MSTTNDLHISVSIPIQFYLKKYLSKKVDVSPFHLSNKGCHISALLLEPIEKGFYPAKIPISAKYNDFLEFKMNTSIIKEGRFHLDTKIVYRINKILEDKFDDEFFHWCENARASFQSEGKSIEINDAITSFMNYYQLHEDDIQFETLKKAYYRFRVPPKPIKKATQEELDQQLKLFVFE